MPNPIAKANTKHDAFPMHPIGRGCALCAVSFLFNRARASFESLRCWENFGRHSQLVGSGFYREVVSQANAVERAAELVRGTLRDGGSELDVLLSPGRGNDRTLVSEYARLVHLRCETAPTFFTPFD